MNESVILATLKGWATKLFAMATAFFDVRSLLLVGGAACVAWYFFADTIKPLLATTGQLTLLLIFLVGVSHLIRKILLSGNFDLQNYAEKALDEPLPSAMVFCVVIWFVSQLITTFGALILK